MLLLESGSVQLEIFVGDYHCTRTNHLKHQILPHHYNDKVLLDFPHS